MLIDNGGKNPAVHEWITENVSDGTMSIVSGYFTVGALAWLSSELKDKITDYRFILGEMVDQTGVNKDALDLLNEELSVEGALQLSALAKEAVAFLSLDKTHIRTLEPNFCHAKLFVFEHEAKKDKENFYITGSSNLTEAGMGLKPTSNVELNHADFGAGDYKEYAKWFNDLWTNEKAHEKKTVILDNGKKEKVDFKQYIIKQIQRIFKAYSPQDIYYKILFELYGSSLHLEEDDAEFNRKIGRLENTLIYRKLYGFQQKGVKSLIRMMDSYGGAILADAVGLGKTWTALAVIKHYEIEGYQSVMLCPKKLEQNWNKFFERENLFYGDSFEYVLRFHTDLQDDRWEHPKYKGKDKFSIGAFNNAKPMLLVIDESHNLRNNKSSRYQWLVEALLKRKKGKLKVLLLSATPINNSLRDLRNQFKLLIKDNDYGFKDTDLAIGSVDYVFRRCTSAMKEWQDEGAVKIGGLIDKLPPEFIRLTDGLLVARNRRWVAAIEKTLHFPKKTKPENIFVTPKNLGDFESFEELFSSFSDRMSGYLPSSYIEIEEGKDVLEDDVQRELFLVKMMHILMTKRLESSWKSLHDTTKKILAHHENALEKVIAFEKDQKSKAAIDAAFEVDEDDDPDLLKYTLGKKSPISLSLIAKAGKLSQFKRHLKADKQKLQQIKVNLDAFEKKIEKELLKPNNYHSADTKLEVLIKKIREKQAAGDNQKVVIFTVYADTANYLYDQLIGRGFTGVAMVSGQGSRVFDEEKESKRFDHILERFAPFTKLFNERKWEGFDSKAKPLEAYSEWLEWLKKEHPSEFEKVQNPIDILIATDTLSEGQNLQDCDMVMNYDIHWNPVRVIQRMGRIDRLGSPNETIYGVNFWPTKTIDDYLFLKDRIEQRMAAMRLAGSEVDVNFSKEFKEMAEDEKLEKRQEEQMLKHMEHTLDEEELEDRSLGLDDFSMENFRQELEQALNRENEYRDLPRGIFSGVNRDDTFLKDPGIIALLGTPRRPANRRDYRYQRYELIYIRENGEPVYLNIKDLLSAMSMRLPNAEAEINEKLRSGDADEISKWKNAIEEWFSAQRSDSKDQAGSEQKQATENGLITQLAAGDLKAVNDIKSGDIPDEIYQADKFDLVCWLTVK